MCGVFGIVSRHKIDPLILSNATNTLRHRGPDGEGTWINREKTVGIGHTRLSIVDLSKRSDQPFQNKRYVISFNGEIYNFRDLRTNLEQKGYHFKTTSDTEVILHAWEEWGSGCLKKFNGCFAFALYDKMTDELFVVRDPLGEKQLVYTTAQNGDFVFASEVKALLKHPNVVAKPNYERFIEDYLFGLYVTPEKTFFKDVFPVPPGSFFHFDLKKNTKKLVQYWSLEVVKTRRVANLADLYEEFNTLLKDSVRLRLDVDAQEGSILSGGIDSSYITSLAAPLYKERNNKDMPCFTVYYNNSSNRDLKCAKKLAEWQSGLSLVPLHIQQGITNKELSDLTWSFERPLCDKSIISMARMYKQIGQRGIKTVLNGEGADELWLGYYKLDPFFRLQKKQINEKFMRNYLYESSLLEEFITNKDAVYNTVRNVIDANLAQNYSPFVSAEPLQRLVYYSLKTHLSEIFAIEDMASMASGVEVRLPHIDMRIVELALSISTSLKIKDGREKYILRQASKDILPDKIRKRAKQGFPSMPYKYDVKDATEIDNTVLLKSNLLNAVFGESVLKKLVNQPLIRFRWNLYAYYYMEKTFFSL